MCGCKHTRRICVYVSMRVHVRVRHSATLRDENSQTQRQKWRERGIERQQKRDSAREKKILISCYVIPPKPDKPPPRLIWLSIQWG